MNWTSLLSTHRIGTSDPERDPDEDRSEFRRDADRIVFSSPFRRMQDKTQVHSLSRSDYVRTRLTHSLEVATIGRSIGAIVGRTLVQRHNNLDVRSSDIADLVQAASLAHDIGNPPFGHSGETVIQEWFANSEIGQKAMALLRPDLRNDFLRFEGNAQGFRILTGFGSQETPGGLQLTCATLGTFTKYIRSSPQSQDLNRVSTKKHGHFMADADIFKEVVTHCDLLHGGRILRHPLAFLMEAADDIAYRIVDIEDGFRARKISFEDAWNVLSKVAGEQASEKSKAFSRKEKQLEVLRAKAIHHCVQQAAATFLDFEDDILHGRFDSPLIDFMGHTTNALDACQQLAVEKIYPDILEDTKILIDLLDRWGPIVWSHHQFQLGKHDLTFKEQSLLKLFPKQFLDTSGSLYLSLLGLTDYISGMTDSYAAQMLEHMRFMDRHF